jgi:hypothetical protein
VNPEHWIPVAVAAKARNATPRQFYAAFDAGMRHSRRGRRIRVRLADWDAWWADAAVGGDER